MSLLTKQINVALVHLGCARNLIDSENILGHLGAGGYALTGDVEQADVAILNTCSFIGPARDESEAAINDLLEAKRSGNLRGVIVAGCLPEKFRDEVVGKFPEVDAFLGLSDYSNVARIVEDVLKGRKVNELSGGRAPQGQGEFMRLLQTPRSYAYLRPSHGCDHNCAFCIIPKIRGKQSSKPIDAVLKETRLLVDKGVCEINLVAEDTTGYGTDFGRGGARLPDLVEAMAQVDGLKWLRVMYAYPNKFPWRLTEVMNQYDNVLPYLDIPTQHIATPVLKRMTRGGTSESVRRIMTRLRDEVPNIALRTTVLVGHPGEGRAEFEELLDWMKEFRFERLGAFTFSPETNTPSGNDADRCSHEEALDRYAELMELQSEIHADFQQSLVGKTTTVLIDDATGETAIGRTWADAPEVDGVVKIDDPQHNLSTGAMVEATIISADGYDLRAELAGR
ncbi:MAG: 30S ribosomal protein S12 methylthiotransferase RimO [Planctomycetes bacterium]|nr:30S ribosomal protein S12 methylthiotransferase RimO [Planctomycetota bacterium]